MRCLNQVNNTKGRGGEQVLGDLGAWKVNQVSDWQHLQLGFVAGSRAVHKAVQGKDCKAESHFKGCPSDCSLQSGEGKGLNQKSREQRATSIHLGSGHAEWTCCVQKLLGRLEHREAACMG